MRVCVNCQCSRRSGEPVGPDPALRSRIARCGDDFAFLESVISRSVTLDVLCALSA